MKKILLAALLFINGLTAFSQTAYNCATDFWTITSDGFIQQWSMVNRTITGGDTILSGGGTSLSFCGDSSAPTFFSNSYTQVGIIYYDQDSGWINIPRNHVVNNNGCHKNDHFYMLEGAVIQVIKYWDGQKSITIDSLNGEFFAGTHDIAVDTAGRAWVFMGAAPSNVDSVKVYTRNGKIASYDISFNITAIGSFFLNDTLYIGSDQDSIYPVLIVGNSALLGESIYFASATFTDMASCQRNEVTNTIVESQVNDIKLFPNPTSGKFSLPTIFEDFFISIYNSDGNLITTNRSLNQDLNNYADGVYIIQVENKNVIHQYKVVKLGN
ncbi:MAG: T9SS type A sorting domain-containing protein [Chitinophagales bacterium]|nr:T9SS type A sorting domain-containing protein [Chitinophagales bacterium]